VFLDQAEHRVGEAAGEPGELAAGQTALVLGATGASGRIAAQLAARQGARVVAAGRTQRVLDDLRARGADAAIRVDRPHDELAAAIAAEGPYDLIVDYLWGAPAEAVFAALADTGGAAERIRYVLVGISAGEVAGVPAIALRKAPVQIFGSGIGGRAGVAESAAAYDGLLKLAAAGEIALDVDPVPLADVGRAWAHPDSARRAVFVP
jgi:NADPH:quinone reductase-like Zn-dependent oxidoreductase